MWKRAINTTLIQLQIPYYTGQQDYRRLHEEVTLLLNPRFVKVEHNGICTLVGIGNIGHKCRMYRIAAMALFRIIEVYDIEFCLLRIFVTMLKEVVIHNGTEICEFEIITVQSKSFLYLLFKEIVYHCIRFAGAGCTQYYCGTERGTW